MKKKNLASYLRPYRKEAVIAPLFKLLEAFFDLLVPLVVAAMIDTPYTEKGRITMYFVILLFMAAFGFSCSIVAQYFAAKASVGYATTLRKELFTHIEKLSFSTLDRIGGSTLITRLTADVNQVQTGLNMSLRLLLRSPFIVFGAAIAAFTINVKAALVFVISIPVLLAVTFLIMKLSIPLFSKSQSALDDVTTATRENLTGVRVIRAFNREKRSTEEFRKSNSVLTRLNLFVGRISSLLNPVTYVLINIATVILIRNSAIEVELGTLQQGEVVALYNYMLQIIVELIKLASLIITINKALACYKRVGGIMNTEEGMIYPSSDPAGADKDTAVEFRNVSFTYPDAAKPSIQGITFEAKKGQTIGIIGGTGSGKTTLINLIPRYYDRTEGTVSVNGNDVTLYTKETISSMVSVVPQKAQLFSGTIRSNMLFGNEKATEDEIKDALVKAQAWEIVEKKGGLDAPVEQNGRNFSGGQKQRLTIARALVKGGGILILDDSSSALDFKTDAELRKAVKTLRDRTVFIVSQRISSVRNADEILVLDRGELVGKGTHEELMESNEIYQDIYYSQFPEERKEVKA